MIILITGGFFFLANEIDKAQGFTTSSNVKEKCEAVQKARFASAVTCALGIRLLCVSLLGEMHQSRRNKISSQSVPPALTAPYYFRKPALAGPCKRARWWLTCMVLKKFSSMRVAWLRKICSAASWLISCCTISTLVGLGLALPRLPVASLLVNVRSKRHQLDTNENVKHKLREGSVFRMTCIFPKDPPDLEKFVKLLSGQDNGAETSAEKTVTTACPLPLPRPEETKMRPHIAE